MWTQPQFILLSAKKALMMSWMKKKSTMNGYKNLASKIVSAFPDYSRSSTNENLIRAVRLWKDIYMYCVEDDVPHICVTTSLITQTPFNGFERGTLKVIPVWGLNLSAWVQEIPVDLCAEFYVVLQNLGLRFNLQTVRLLSQHLLFGRTSDSYSSNIIDPQTEQALSILLTHSGCIHSLIHAE